ncbi:hypothetical protein MettiDRAFT_1141 [Methanolobus tindarius DSM 2278]|uniref:Uncharacterized protein n=1 Tax=Methanolobus tindarius DSM 2278 TaxID=1090322 RepID=W9DQQ8_METTI|nr:hypothetical protein [Methanolobus tindarius]ETA67710.1 hypothetical protein MettiDRAFT_1141 [Methanolobus tindarius DSM 2278]
MNFKIILLAGLVFAIISGMTGTSCAAISDTVGDFDSQDISSLDVSSDGNNLYITITCTDSVTDYSFYGAVFVDTDQNVLTGYADNGADYVYQFGYMSIIYSEPMVTTTLNDNTLYSDSIYVQGNQIFITLPLSALGNDDGNMNVVVVLHDQMVKALDFDRAPDQGVFNTATRSIETSGLNLAGGIVTDKIGDSNSADIREMSASVTNGVLNIEVTYNQNIEPSGYSYGEDVTGWISIDTDQKLATGFTNTEQAPPTFGVDYRIEYAVGTLTGTDASIKMLDTDSDMTSLGYSDTKSKSIGVPYNDASFKVSGNKVSLEIPLTMLGNDDGNMYITTDSFSLQGSMNGEIESVPDYGQGALNTADGSIKPLLAYGTDKKTLTDAAADSAGFGYDGDDIVTADIGFTDNIMLITIAYSSLELDDGAITTVYFDTNQDNSPDYMLSLGLYNGVLSGTIFGMYNGKYSVREATHLITMQGNKMYVSVPAEFLPDDGNMDIFFETAMVPYDTKIPESKRAETGTVYINPDSDGRSLYDRAPDTGVFTIGANGNFQTANTDNNNVQQDGQEKEGPGFSSLMGVAAVVASLYILRRRN